MRNHVSHNQFPSCPPLKRSAAWSESSAISWEFSPNFGTVRAQIARDGIIFSYGTIVAARIMHISRVIRRNTSARNVSHFRERVGARERVRSIHLSLSLPLDVLAWAYIKLNGRCQVPVCITIITFSRTVLCINIWLTAWRLIAIARFVIVPYTSLIISDNGRTRVNVIYYYLSLLPLRCFFEYF